MLGVILQMKKMRQLFLLILTTFLLTDSFAQTMTSIFRQLPSECTPELSSKQRDTLVVKGEYVVPGGDSIETLKYSIETNETKDYLRYEYNFTTGQSGFIVFELRRFQKENGKKFVVFSRFGGVSRNYYQHDLKVFDIEGAFLKENNSQTLLPKEVGIDSFLKEETQDTVKTIIERAVNSCYSLYPEVANQIDWTIIPEYSEEYEPFVLAYTLTFTWTGLSFERKLITKK